MKELAEWYCKGGEKAKALAAKKEAVRQWEKDLKIDALPLSLVHN